MQYVRKNVSPEEYYKSIFPNVSWPLDNKETKVLSPFVKETVPSLSLNKDTGAWYSFCASDERGGNSIISFEAARRECSNREAAEKIFQKFIHPVISKNQIRKWTRKLNKTPSALKYLRKRGLSKKIIRQHRLGWNGTRITFPILNEFGLCVNAKLGHPSPREGISKMLNYTEKKESRSFGSPTMLYPLSSLLENPGDSIFICEGEWDTLVLLSLGIFAVTSTAGAKTWPHRYNPLFQNKKVILVYDNDKPGKIGAQRVFHQLLNIAKSIKQITIPSRYGKDVSDYVLQKKQMRCSKAWKHLAHKAKLLADNPEELTISQKETIQVALDQASQSTWYGQRLQIDALITGKDIAPYLIPRKYRISCTLDCENCVLTKEGKGFKDIDLSGSNDYILNMLDSSSETNRRRLLILGGVQPKKQCRAKIDYLKVFNVELILLIPTLSSDSKEYVQRKAFYIGHGLRANKSYRFTGYMVTSPKTQHIVFLFDKAQPLQDEVETFELEDTTKEKLVRFRPRTINYFAHLQSIADWQSRHLTKIIERPDLHIIVDLAFHSVSSFWFNQEFIPRGMLDILIIGDTRCGKGYVTEGLNRYYKLGEIATGDNCSFAGLVGGLQQIGTNWRITWGMIPLNNNRLVIIDETSSLTERDIGRMSRIRSEGVAEIVKIIHESTQANTRLIWLSNPRSGRPISTYNYGVQAIKELVGAVEDLSRFDLALTVASSEVDSEIINAPAKYDVSDIDKYPRELCQALILWAWSRTPSQIHFTTRATNFIIKEAIKFGHFYSSSIPLVQAENIRIKIAKISAAVAARTFSTDDTFEKLIVKTVHVKCATQIMRNFYNKSSMAYDLYSRTASATSQMGSLEEIEKVFDVYCGSNKSKVYTGLLEIQHLNPDNLSDYVGDISTARSLMGELVQLKCLSRIEDLNCCSKTTPFVQWLRKKEISSRKKEDKQNGRRSKKSKKRKTSFL